MHSIETLKYLAQQLLLDARAVERFIKLDKFLTVYPLMNEADKQLAQDAVECLEVGPLKLLATKYRLQQLEELSWHSLRTECSRLMVPGYSGMTRDEMICSLRAILSLRGQDDSKIRVGHAETDVGGDGPNTS